MLVWLPKGLFSHIFDYSYGSKMGCPGGLAVKKKKKKKNLPAMQERRQALQAQSLGWEDLLEKGMAMHSIFIA